MVTFNRLKRSARTSVTHIDGLKSSPSMSKVKHKILPILVSSQHLHQTNKQFSATIFVIAQKSELAFINTQMLSLL